MRAPTGGRMDRKKLETIIQEFRRSVKEIEGNNLKAILLFGSYARGDAEEGSDIDLLLIFGDKISPEAKRGIRDISNALSFKYDVIVSEFFFTEKEFGKYNTPFLLNVKREGIPV